MDILGLVVFLIIIGLAFWAVNTLSATFGIPAPIVTVINVILVILIIIYLLGLIGYGPGIRLSR